jgi:hypothetical protein
MIENYVLEGQSNDLYNCWQNFHMLFLVRKWERRSNVLRGKGICQAYANSAAHNTMDLGLS